MRIKSALRLVRHAFLIAGTGAPALLARYARLWMLHRNYSGMRIKTVPSIATNSVYHSLRPGSADLVIPIYNAFEDTRALLEQIRPTAASHRSLILVNDCSTDARLLPMLRAYASEVENATLIENSCNLGFVRSCNRGFERAGGDVVILNTDIELPEGAVGRMLAALYSSSDIATVTPFSNSAYGVGFPDLIHHNELPFGATTDEVDRAFQALSGFSPIDIPRGVGFCMAISRKMMDLIGPFSLDYGQGYGEEADFCMRARQAGYRSVIAPNAYVYHKAGQSFGGKWQEKARAGQLMFLDRHPHYVEMMEEFLGRCEARAAGLIALVALTRALSGIEPAVILGGNAHTRALVAGDGPVITVDSDAADTVSLRLSFRGETYAFAFSEAPLAREALRMAGLEPGVI